MSVAHAMQSDTVFALSSGRLPAGIAVVRITGPHTRDILVQLTGSLPLARYAAFRSVKDRTGQVIDHGLVLFFPGPGSFTGEDSAEFQVHGSVAVVDALLAALSTFDGCRLAEPGEFTRRAFSNGKMDLTMAEGLADLINAETESQRRLAVEVSSGAQRDIYKGWRRELIEGRALIEAELDFSDESDVPGAVSDIVWPKMQNLSERIHQHIESGKRGSIIRDGFRIAILGAPNAGKSSLLNALAGRDVAIVSEEAGTTRDLIEVRLNLGGVAVFVTDTAGLRETDQKVEKIGIERAIEKAATADLALFLEDSVNPISIDEAVDHGQIIRIGTKSDLSAGSTKKWDFVISTMTGDGLDDLVAKLTSIAVSAAGDSSDPLPTRRRHMDLLTKASDEIVQSTNLANLPLELRAEHLRRASTLIGRITGDVDVEEILDVVFSEFCIGK